MQLTILSGTNRPKSNTLKIAKFSERLLTQKISKHDEILFLDLQDLPLSLFSPTSYQEKPKEFEGFVKAIAESDALLIVVPEYNGGPPGVLKYFIDMLPFPQSLQKLPSLFIGVAAGRFGGLRPVEQMQEVFRYRNAYLYPESVYLTGVFESLEADGKPKDEATVKLIHQSFDGFLDFARKLSKKPTD